MIDKLTKEVENLVESMNQSLICALCRSSRLKEVEVLFENMLGKKWNNDEIVWTILIDGLLKERESELCMKLLHVMESKSCNISFQTYVILARELSKLDG